MKVLVPKSIKKNMGLYIMLIPVLLYFIVFHYWPMYGVQIAFKNFYASQGIWDSPWVGFTHFERFFNSYYFVRLIKNTIGISLYSLVVGFPIPLLLALMMNEMRNRFLKKTVQTITYAPHFLSVVVLTGIVIAFLHPKNGIINNVIQLFGMEPISFMTEPAWFKSIYVWSGVWQSMGWNSIIYMAALAGIDTQQYEAAIIDGASKFQRMLYVTIPGIMPTAIILLILNCGSIMNVGFEKIFLLQNDINKPASDVISIFVYNSGILGGQYSFSTAIGLFNSMINFTLLLLVNRLSRKFTQTSLW
ncbi:MAG: sugar transporter permease [Paenibacillus sp.]|nr:sugar transporter permease [Paenibacillus sp.]